MMHSIRIPRQIPQQPITTENRLHTSRIKTCHNLHNHRLFLSLICYNSGKTKKNNYWQQTGLILIHSANMKTEAEYSSETLVPSHQTRRCPIPGDKDMNPLSREDLKIYTDT
jgi:hypothetical protein